MTNKPPPKLQLSPKPEAGTPPGRSSTSARPAKSTVGVFPSASQAAKEVPFVRPAWYKRKYLVYPKFQMTLILLNSAVTLVLFGLIAFMVIRSHLYLENLVKQTRLPAQNLFIQLLTEQLRSLLIYMFVALGIGVFTTATFTLLISHKMAGPMIRLRHFFTTVSKSGNFPEQLRFRDGDFFQDLPPAVNQAFTVLKKRWQR